jgi:hypothetical protein
MINGEELGVVPDQAAAERLGPQHGGGTQVRGRLRRGWRANGRAMVGGGGVQIDLDGELRALGGFLERRP